MKAPKVILASASPRRQQFFQSLGIPFLPESADIDETPAVNESPAALVERLATAKALTVGNRRHSPLTDETKRAYQGDYLVVGADTVVAIAGEILGKPAHIEEAYAMLVNLRARSPPGPYGAGNCPLCKRKVIAFAHPRQHHDRKYALLPRQRGRCIYSNGGSHGQGRRLRHSASAVQSRSQFFQAALPV